MEKSSLTALAREQLAAALRSENGRSASTVYGGHERRLRQTVIGLAAGEVLSDHDNPGEATVLVLSGRIRLATDDVSWDGAEGDLINVPHARHNVTALQDSAILLTAVPLR